MAAAAMLKKSKNQHISCGLNDFDEILHSDAVQFDLLDRSDR